MRYAKRDNLQLIVTLAWRNILRQRGRTAMTLAAVALGVASLVLAGGFVQDVFIQLAEALIHSKSGHIQVAKGGFFSYGSRSPGVYIIEDPESDRATIQSLREDVAEVMMRISFTGLLNNGHTDAPVIGEGIEPDREARLGTYTRIVAGRQLAEADTYGILVGEGVARSLSLHPGDRVTLTANTLEGALNTFDLVLIGVFQTFSKEFDTRAIKIRLKAATDLLNTKGANSLVVVLKATERTEQVAGRLRNLYREPAYELKTWSQLNDFYEKTAALYKTQFGVLKLVILFMVVLGVANTVNLTIMERSSEFGTMRALGNRGLDVLVLVMTEAALLGAIGACLGVLVGVLLAILASWIGIPMPPPPSSDVGYTAYIRVVPSVIATAFLVGITATILAALLPAFRVSRAPIAMQLRQAI